MGLARMPSHPTMPPRPTLPPRPTMPPFPTLPACPTMPALRTLIPFPTLDFTSIDADGDGFLERNEIIVGLRKHGVILNAKSATAFIRRIDNNRDGVLDAKE